MRNDFETNYLVHWGIAKGGQRQNHKYIERIVKNGRYIYFYTLAQYNAYMKGKSGGGTSTTKKQTNTNKKPVNVLSNKARAEATIASGQKTITELQSRGFAIKGSTSKEKEKNLQNNISSGEKQINSQISKSSTNEEESSKKSKSSGSGSSKKDSNKSIGKGKGSSGSSKSSGSKEKSEKSSSSKAKESSKTTKEKKQASTTPVTLDTLKKNYDIKDEDITSYKTSAEKLQNEMLSKYDEGDFGYMTAGDTVYKWTIEGGKLILKDFSSDKEVSITDFAKEEQEFKEFQTNKKKK
jgi:hypothetical protein